MTKVIVGGGFLSFTLKTLMVAMRFLERNEEKSAGGGTQNNGDWRNIFEGKKFGLNNISNNAAVGDPKGTCVILSEFPENSAWELEQDYKTENIDVTVYPPSGEDVGWTVFCNADQLAFRFMPMPT